MPIPSKPGLFRRLPILAPSLVLSLVIAPAASAQLPPGAVVQPLPQSSDPAELLAQALRTLATEPANFAALTAAGHNALVLGDPNAAVGFFGRAQEIAPSNGAVKAGLGSALVQLEKPRDALRLFGEASRLGVADADIAEDRGLAYDLTGQQALAQHDYQTVLAAHPEDETARRRLALSQGIAGDKAGAIATLDPLIRKRDIAGWRAQTFVLAMDGDPQGANAITRIMLPQQSAMLQPFLVRLAGLSPADRARAVHFGEMPAAGATYTPVQVASVDTPATYASAPTPRPRSDLAPMPQPAPRAPVAVAVTPPATTAPPVRTASVPPPQPVPTYEQSAPLAGIALTPVQPAPAVSPPPTPAQPATATPLASAAISPAPTPVPTQIAQAAPLRSDLSGPPAPALPTPATEGHYDLPHDAAEKSGARPSRPVAVAAPSETKTIGTPVVHGKTAAPVTVRGDDEAIEIRPKPTVVVTSSPARTKLAAATDAAAATPAKGHSAKAAEADDADVKPARKGAKALASSDDCAPAPKGRAKTKARGKSVRASAACVDLAAANDGGDSPAKVKRGAKARGAKVPVADDDDTPAKASRSAIASKAADKAVAERVYVQVAGGANRDDMDKAWAGVKHKAPDLMKGHKPLTTPLRATNRLLVGPFKDEDEAQAFVNRMATKGLSGFTFKSGKGQKVETIDGDR